ncbi:hypothetical protein FVB9532_01567 [Mesonia oceanica]|uniref:Uncharacterized protein n=1 Tax=Mesonia oceanica TaxID=2687242 RepID=A0AC61Y7Y4_9FLAO|nr:hypothetical protein FVB9532_01567 [Mesonia oceanica]
MNLFLKKIEPFKINFNFFLNEEIDLEYLNFLKIKTVGRKQN